MSHYQEFIPSVIFNFEFEYCGMIWRVKKQLIGHITFRVGVIKKRRFKWWVGMGAGVRSPEVWVSNLRTLFWVLSNCAYDRQVDKMKPDRCESMTCGSSTGILPTQKEW